MLWDTGTLAIFGFILLVVCVWILFLWQNTRRMHEQLKQVAQQQSLIRHDDSVRELCRAVHLLQPNAHAGVDYVIRHDNAAQEPYLAEWNAIGQQPTREELRDALAKIVHDEPGKNYASMRRAEYPSVGNQLDAAYKARQGDDTEQLEIDDQIRKVKDKYPKSIECL
jgi:XkdW protein